MHTTDLRVLSMVSMMALLSTGSVHIEFDL
jgi:hypothetical protein